MQIILEKDEYLNLRAIGVEKQFIEAIHRIYQRYDDFAELTPEKALSEIKNELEKYNKQLQRANQEELLW